MHTPTIDASTIFSTVHEKPYRPTNSKSAYDGLLRPISEKSHGKWDASIQYVSRQGIHRRFPSLNVGFLYSASNLHSRRLDSIIQLVVIGFHVFECLRALAFSLGELNTSKVIPHCLHNAYIRWPLYSHHDDIFIR